MVLGTFVQSSVLLATFVLLGPAGGEGEASLRSVLGRIRAYRHYVVPEALPAELLVPLHVLALVHREGPQRKRRRAEVSSVESGPAPSLCGHMLVTEFFFGSEPLMPQLF